MTQKLPISISEGRPGDGKAKPDQSPSGIVYEFGPFQLDPARHELRRRDVRVRVAPAPMDLLLLLIKRRDFLVNREEIATRLWTEPSMVDIDQGINTAIRRIREVLGDTPSEPRYIETVVGKGYRFIAEVKEVTPEPASAPLPASPHIPDKSESSEKRSKSAGPSETPELSVVPEQRDSPTRESQPKNRRKGIAIAAAIAFLFILGIAYIGWRHQKYNALRYTTSLVQITTNDSEQRVIAAAISPDGKWIAYADVDGLSLRLLQSGKTIPLKAPEEFYADHIAWFPDQTRILVSGYDTYIASSRIWTVSITGSAPQLFQKDARNGIASPDGTRVAYTTNKDREIWTSGADGENARALVVDPSGKSFSSLFWSGDGKRVSYRRNRNGLGEGERNNLGEDYYESADANSGKVLAIEKNVTFESAGALADGRMFFLHDAPTGFHNAYSLWEVDTKTSSGAFVSRPKQIATLDQAKAFGLTTSDDGSRMSIILARGQPHVYVGTLQQPGPVLENVQRLTHDTRTDYPHSWLPDNQTVIYESNRSGIYRLYEQRLQDHTPQELNTGTGQAVLPQVTPDGKWILYAVKPDAVPSPKDKLLRIPVRGGPPEQIAVGRQLDEFSCPLFGHSGCVLRETEDKKEFVYYALDPVTGKGRELGRTAWLPHVIGDWCVSPDGLAIALTSHDAGNPRIRIVPFNNSSGHHERELAVRGFGMLSGVNWSADGKGWFVAADTGAGTSILYVNQQGESHVLRVSPSGSWGVPSPDGSKLAFVDQAADSNVWMWNIGEQH